MDHALTARHYMEYLLERDGLTAITRPEGLVLYKPLMDGLYIETIYVRPEFRQSGIAASMLQEVELLTKYAGLSKVYGSCDPKAKGATISMQSMFATGFKLIGYENGLNWLVKEI